MVQSCQHGQEAIMGVPVPTGGTIRTIGANGQISLGKHLAGRQVLVEEQEPGVWLIRTATVVPDNERWLHAPQAAGDLERALAWARDNQPHDGDVDAVLAKLNDQT
jgi:hypothetical protein